MLQLQLADSLARQRAHDLRADAQLAHAARAVRTDRRARHQRAPLRVRIGWWLVARGLRMAVWDRHPPGAQPGTALTAGRSLAGRSLPARP